MKGSRNAELNWLWWGRIISTLLLLLTDGCAHAPRHERSSALSAEQFLPAPPAFIAGPAALLLTNQEGFSAHLVMTLEAPSDDALPLSGQLLQRKHKLLFEPDPGDSRRKHSRMGEFSFIWDVVEDRGYVLSEALQGYAPINSTNQFTNLVVQRMTSPLERVEGHLVERASATVSANNGKQTTFRLLQARDLNSLAIQIDSTNESPHFKLTLSKIRFEEPREELFLPPDGFTKYVSEEALVNELIARQQSKRQMNQSADSEHTGGGRRLHSRGVTNSEP